jgi:hypothetical protein
LPYAADIKVFGSMAYGSTDRDPRDIDLFIDLRGKTKHSAWTDLLRLAKEYYTYLDPFIIADAGIIDGKPIFDLWARNDHATGWIRSRNKKKMLKNMSEQNKPLTAIRPLQIRSASGKQAAVQVGQRATYIGPREAVYGGGLEIGTTVTVTHVRTDANGKVIWVEGTTDGGTSTRFAPHQLQYTKTGAQKYTPQQIEQEAAMWQDQFGEDEPGGGPATKYVWHQDDHFPVSKLSGTAAEWKEWLDQEKKWAAEDGREGYYEGMEQWWTSNPDEHMVVAQGTDGQFYVWEGTHRQAISKIHNMQTVPVFVGVLKEGSKVSAKTAAQNWYHGTSVKNGKKVVAEGWLRPGMPTKYTTRLRPRNDAVYITKNYKAARDYARKMDGDGMVITVEVSDNSKLIPDEDAINIMLATHARAPQGSNKVYWQMTQEVVRAAKAFETATGKKVAFGESDDWDELIERSH